MIRVNLLKNVAQDRQAPSAFTQTSIEVFESPSSKAQFIKMVLLFGPLVAFFVYRTQMVSAAQGELAAVQAQLARVDLDLKALEPAVKELERFQEEKKKLNAQLEVIKKLSKERLKVVKSLDAIQTLIPSKSWLTGVRIDESSKLDMEGFATDDIVVSDFMKALESSIFFNNVLLISSEEAKTESGVVKRFSVKASTENF